MKINYFLILLTYWFIFLAIIFHEIIFQGRKLWNQNIMILTSSFQLYVSNLLFSCSSLSLKGYWGFLSCSWLQVDRFIIKPLEVRNGKVWLSCYCHFEVLLHCWVYLFWSKIDTEFCQIHFQYPFRDQIVFLLIYF